MSHIWAGRLAYILGVIVLGAIILFGWGQGGSESRSTSSARDTLRSTSDNNSHPSPSSLRWHGQPLGLAFTDGDIPVIHGHYFAALCAV